MGGFGLAFPAISLLTNLVRGHGVTTSASMAAGSDASVAGDQQMANEIAADSQLYQKFGENRLQNITNIDVASIGINEKMAGLAVLKLNQEFAKASTGILGA